jgi:hypothetical protein
MVCLEGSGFGEEQVQGGGDDESKEAKKRWWLRMVSLNRARARTVVNRLEVIEERDVWENTMIRWRSERWWWETDGW